LVNFFKNLTMASGFLWLVKLIRAARALMPVGGHGSREVNHANDEGGGDLRGRRPRGLEDREPADPNAPTG
jgi:hypothetical protein